MPTLHAHLDESGDLNFTPRGSKFYIFAVAWTFDPQSLANDLVGLRFGYLKQGVDLHRFHACEDQQRVRDAVVAKLVDRATWAYAALVIEKNKVNPAIRDEHHFYPKFATMLLRFVLRGCVRASTQQVLIFTDDLPVKKKRDAVKKAINVACRGELPPRIRFGCYHHPCASNKWLQVADYCAWAVGRKWERGDPRTYDQLRSRLERSELNVTARGMTTYYDFEPQQKFRIRSQHATERRPEALRESEGL